MTKRTKASASAQFWQQPLSSQEEENSPNSTDRRKANTKKMKLMKTKKSKMRLLSSSDRRSIKNDTDCLMFSPIQNHDIL